MFEISFLSKIKVKEINTAQNLRVAECHLERTKTQYSESNYSGYTKDLIKKKYFRRAKHRFPIY